MGFDTKNYYYSGQGVVMLAARDANGNPTGYRVVGNVSALNIAIAATIVDHKNSQDGQRAIDARLQTETKSTLTMTLDNWISANLAQALRGSSTTIQAGAAVAEVLNCYPGLVTGTQYTNISSFVLSQGASALVPYVNDATPYDYKVNLAAGSVMLNDNETASPAKLGTTATAVAVGETTSITVPFTGAVGDPVYLYGFVGADAALINGVPLKVATVVGGGTGITVAVNTTGKVITDGAGSMAYFYSQPLALTASYNYSAQSLTDALTEPLTSIAMRFEGLNTAEGNDPVVIEVFKFSTDPLKELAMLSDTFGQMQLEGAILADYTKETGSKYFHVKSLS